MTPTGPRRASHLAVGVALGALALVTGCSAEPEPVFGAQRSSVADVVPLPVPEFDSREIAASTTLASFTVREYAVLPDPAVTPGSTFSDVTAADVCDLHYTQGVRQPRFNDKVAAFGRYGISIRARDSYRVDHLVPVSLGGNNALENLWPQPYDGRGALQKDEVERHLHGLVCAGVLPLAEAQQALAQDWAAAAARWLPVALPPGAVVPGQPGDEPPDAVDPFAVTNGGPCPTEGAVGRTEGKGIRFSCQRGDDGSLRWGKRY